MARILLLDGHSAAALAFTRSAGKAGHWVAVGADTGVFAAAQLSRFCRLAFVYPKSTGDVQEFVDAIVHFVRQNSVDLIVPITDWTLQPVSGFRELFTGICRVALPPKVAVETAADKYRTIEIARELGIATPSTWLIKTFDEVNALPELSFPVVVKDRFSIRRVSGQSVFGSVSYAHCRADLDRICKERIAAAGEVLVQAFMPGDGIGFSCFVTAADVFLPFEWERIREVDPRGSASSCRKAIRPNEKVVLTSGRLMRAIGFAGIAMVEYKRSQAGLVLMEINGRPWGSIALPIACGLDYPRYLIDWWLDGSLPPNEIQYREGTVCRRIVSELSYLSNVHKGKPENWSRPYPNFWSSLLKIAVPWYPRMHYDDLWLSDPRPGLAEIRHWFAIRTK